MCRCVVNGLFCVALSDTYRVHQTRCIWNIISWDCIIMISNKVRLMKKAVERFISQAVATVKMSSIAFLELHVNPENEDEVINLVRCVRPQWTKEDIVCTSITELGFVNYMRCFHLKQDPNKDDGLVVRIFGSALGRACSREREFLSLQVGTWTSCQTSNYALRWRHNGHYCVSNHQPHHCLLNRLFGRRSKKTSKLRVTGLCVGNSPGPVNSPHKWPVTRKMFPFYDVIMWPVWKGFKYLTRFLKINNNLSFGLTSLYWT